jgi:hypothetical protein
MKRMPDIRCGKSVIPADHKTPPLRQSQDRLVFIALVIAGMFLVGAYHYSLEQLSAFYGLIIAVQAARQGRHVA